MRALLLLALLAAPAAAVQPDEILPDPVLEQRAREISKDVRCLVCRNEAIDESRAELARDMRLLVRERLVAGDTNAEVRQYLVDRYGEYVLLNPPFNLGNALLWLSGPVLFILGAGLAWSYIRASRSATPATEAALTPEERAALDRLLHESEDDAPR
ncbi:MAG: cytochrome c-type biogenesis protein [Pseudomonadota bacterium]